jgi:hypothetical protein
MSKGKYFLVLQIVSKWPFPAGQTGFAFTYLWKLASYLYILYAYQINSFLEDAQPAIVRAICSTNRPFFMSVFDKTSKNKILEFERLMKCCSPILFPSSRATIVVRDRRAQILGFVKHA